MKLPYRIASLLRNLFRKGRTEADLNEEIGAYLEILTAKNIERGLDPAESRRLALIEFGGIEQVKDKVREGRMSHFAETLMQDILHGLRTLCKSPGFTAIVLLTLALGIGANTAMFSVVEGVVLSPLPYAQPEKLVAVWASNYHAPQMDTSYPDFLDWQRYNRSFQQIAAFNFQEYDLTSPGAVEHLKGKEISSGFFSTLSVKLNLGREFSAQEDQHGGARVAIISDRLWKNRFAGQPDALGQAVTLNGIGYTVVGILPSGFRFINDADVYTPVGQDDPAVITDRTIHEFSTVARLRPGVTLASAKAEMTEVQNNIDRTYPAEDRGVGTDVVPLKQQIVGDIDKTLLMLLGAAGLVLLIACANVASLLLARSAARSREFAIRAALGASRARIVRQLITESVILSFAGGVLGLAIAKWGVKPLLAAIQGSLPRADSIDVNAPVLLFSFGISITVGILFGLAPALKSSKTDLRTTLNEGSRGSTHAHHRAQSTLVIVQMALTLVLLLSVGLLFRTIRYMWSINPGFDTKNIITFNVGLSPSVNEKPANVGIAYQQLIQRIREIPGVQAADFTNIIPLSGEDNGSPFWFGPQKPASMAEAPRLLMFWTGSEYLKSMGIPLLQGQYLSREDTINSAPVIVIDSALAHAYFSDKDPVGQTMSIAHWGAVRIVGVVGHVTHWGLDRPNFYTQNQAYGAFSQIPEQFVSVFKQQTVIVRTPLEPAAIMPEIKEAVYTASSDQPVFNVQTIHDVVAHSMSSQRLPVILLSDFSVLALFLATVGIYGVVSYSVTLRMHEIGIRMALGAEKQKIFSMVIGQGLRLSFSGLAIGAAGALILTRIVSSFSGLLYGVGKNDPVTFVITSIVLIGVAIFACYVPARRAANVDPMEALR